MVYKTAGLQQNTLKDISLKQLHPTTVDRQQTKPRQQGEQTRNMEDKGKATQNLENHRQHLDRNTG